MTARLVSTAAAAYLAFATPSAAQEAPGWLRRLWWSWRSPGGPDTPPSSGSPAPHQVPEIDASAGLLSLAAVAVVLLFVWERRRRGKARDQSG